MANSPKIASDPMRVPEPGELVEVRRRQWLVSDVDPYRPEGDDYRRQDLVTLESIEEDAGGEQISVVWQIEPGARILEKAGLPEVNGYDNNEQLQAFSGVLERRSLGHRHERGPQQPALAFSQRHYNRGLSA